MLYKLFKEKKVYVLITIIILLIGYIFIFWGFTSEDNSKIGPILISIGTSLIAAGIVAVLDFWKHISGNKIFEKINNVIFNAGINYVYEKRDLDKYDGLMNNIKDSLDISGYSLLAFYESYGELLINKCKSKNSIFIRILVVDPDSTFSKDRELIEGNVPFTYKNRLDRMAESFKRIKNIKIKKIATPLTTMFFKIDDYLFIGPHLFKKPSKSTITFELNNKGWLFFEYLKDFEKLWNEGTDY